MGRTHRSGLVVLAALLSACTFPQLTTPTPRPVASPTAAPTTTPSPPTTPTLTPDPTPDPAVPSFASGEIVETATDGLRVRQRPGRSSVVIAGLLPLGAQLQVVMGPIPVDDFSWYLVSDAGDEPRFTEGWIAAGYEPDPFLRSTGRVAAETPYVAGYALTGDADYGPVEIADEHHAIRWIAVDPIRRRCQFSVLLAPADGNPVTAIRATLGRDVVPGTLQPTFFAAQPGVRGQVFVTIQSDCAWSLVLMRVAPPPDEDD